MNKFEETLKGMQGRRIMTANVVEDGVQFKMENGQVITISLDHEESDLIIRSDENEG